MEVSSFRKEDGCSLTGYMVTVNEVEALEIAENLLYQIRNRTSNGGRLETYTKKGEYFSIAVQTNKEVNELFFNKPII